MTLSADASAASASKASKPDVKRASTWRRAASKACEQAPIASASKASEPVAKACKPPPKASASKASEPVAKACKPPPKASASKASASTASEPVAKASEPVAKACEPPPTASASKASASKASEPVAAEESYHSAYSAAPPWKIQSQVSLGMMSAASYKQAWKAASDRFAGGITFDQAVSNLAIHPQIPISISHALQLASGDVVGTSRRAIPGVEVLRLPSPYYQSLQSRTTLRSVLLALAKWSNMAQDMANTAIPMIVVHMAQLSARVLATCESKWLTFRIISLIYQQFQLQDYLMPSDDLPFGCRSQNPQDPESLAVEAGMITPFGLVPFFSDDSSGPRRDAFWIWQDLQHHWPDLADVFGKHRLEEKFLEITEFWLSTLLLQSHEPLEKMNMNKFTSDRPYAGDSIDLLHRVVMAALRGDGNSTESADDGDDRVAVNSSFQKDRTRQEKSRNVKDPRHELRYLVLCIWLRSHRTIFRASCNEKLSWRLDLLKYDFQVDAGLFQLMDERYHMEACGGSAMMMGGLVKAVPVASAAGLVTSMICPPLGVASFAVGAICGYISGASEITASCDTRMAEEAMLIQLYADILAAKKKREKRHGSAAHPPSNHEIRPPGQFCLQDVDVELQLQLSAGSSSEQLTAASTAQPLDSSGLDSTVVAAASTAAPATMAAPLTSFQAKRLRELVAEKGRDV